MADDRLKLVTIAIKGPPGPGLGPHENSTAKSHIVICTSITRPSEPFAGQHIYETDTNLFNFWDGDSWEEVAPDLGGDGPGPNGWYHGELVCLVERVQDLPVSNNTTKAVEFDTEHYDPNNVFNGSAFSLPIGRYSAEVSIAWDDNASGGRWVHLTESSDILTPDQPLSVSQPAVTDARQSGAGGFSVHSEAFALNVNVRQNSSGQRTIGQKAGTLAGRTTCAIYWVGPL